MEDHVRVTCMVAAAFALAGCPSLEGFAGPSDAGTCPNDLKSDPLHCGRCDRSCLGSACTNGECAPTTILTGQPFLTNLLAGDGWVYFLTDSNVTGSSTPTEAVACKASDCLGTRVIMDPLVRPRGLALSATTIYFSYFGVETFGNPDIGGIKACARPSCASGARSLVGALGEPLSLTVTSSGAVVWADARRATVEWCADPCTKRHVLATGQAGIRTVRASGDTVYWSTTSEVRRADLGDNPPSETVVAKRGGAIGDFVLPGTRVVWTVLNDPGVIESCEAADCAGTTRTEIANLPTPKLLSVTDRAIVWTSPSDLAVKSCPKTDCRASTVRHLEATPLDAALLTEDDTSFYWATSQKVGTIERLAK